jgi:hydrogenase/urease accessory protein HupE
MEQRIRSAFKIHNGQAPCFIETEVSRKQENIGSRQFEYGFKCPLPLTELVVEYNLFFDLESTHENFARVDFQNSTQNFTFANDYRQHVIPIEAMMLESLAARDTVLKSSQTPLGSSSHYFRVGIQHILTGVDHLVFLVALLLLPCSMSRLFALITTFTVAHSITLALSVFDIIAVPPLIVESAIALSITFVAIENYLVLQRAQGAKVSIAKWRRRLLTTFGFGLVHGFGFSYILGEIGLGEQVMASLLFFNLGVETGQLLAVCLLFPIVMRMFARFNTYHWAQISSLAVAALGVYWLYQRSSEFSSL